MQKKEKYLFFLPKSRLVIEINHILGGMKARDDS